jgi:hypothetical protein
MMDEQDVRDRLGAAEVPPTRLRVQAVVAAGRRRVFRRRAVQAIGGAALATGVLMAVPSLVPVPSNDLAGSQQGEVRCAAAKLPVLAGMTAVTAVAVDPAGKYIVGNNVGDKEASQPILWTNGRPRALPAVGGSVHASDVNAAGAVAAVAGDAHSVYRYVDGVPAKLTPPPGDWIFWPKPRINARGDVLVSARQKSKGEAIVLLWKAESPTAARISLPAGARGADITDDGTIVGDVVTGSDITAYAWDQRGNGRKLTTPAGQSGEVHSAQGTWATGNVVSSGTAVRWNLRTGAMTDLHVPATATAINARGWIIVDGSLQRDGVTVKLEPSKGATNEPADVSDAGLVVGTLLGYDKDGSTTSKGPLTWRCDR